MDFLVKFRKAFILSLLLPVLTGCQAGYLIENGYYQAKMLLSRIPNSDALNDEKLTDKQRAKIKLAEDAREFAEQKLGLKESDNYKQFADLGRPYIVHSLTVAKKNEIKPYRWWFPFFGSFPYLGYYNKESALRAQKKFNANDYDTYVRGVSAFSSLGWFKDPILSSMLRYSDYDLVNLIIHETVHATIYIKDAVEFNERLAVFIGNIGTEKYYLEKEGPYSKTLENATNESYDDKLFSQFITQEIKELEIWYDKQKLPINEEARQKRLRRINENFTLRLQSQLKSKSYNWFASAQLNNARLINYKTYMQDLSDFEKVYESLDRDFNKLITYAKSLEKEDSPEKALKEKAATYKKNSNKN